MTSPTESSLKEKKRNLTLDDKVIAQKLVELKVTPKKNGAKTAKKIREKPKNMREELEPRAKKAEEKKEIRLAQAAPTEEKKATAPKAPTTKTAKAPPKKKEVDYSDIFRGVTDRLKERKLPDAEIEWKKPKEPPKEEVDTGRRREREPERMADIGRVMEPIVIGNIEVTIGKKESDYTVKFLSTKVLNSGEVYEDKNTEPIAFYSFVIPIENKQPITIQLAFGSAWIEQNVNRGEMSLIGDIKKAVAAELKMNKVDEQTALAVIVKISPRMFMEKGGKGGLVQNLKGALSAVMNRQFKF
ncbi:MAG: hypothetical protein V1492_04755 [Candidatus Micrarchaeota archaeon]